MPTMQSGLFILEIMKRLLLSTWLIFFSIVVGLSQNKQIDSLLLVLKNAKQDTNKVNGLNKLCGVLIKNRDSSHLLAYAQEALQLSRQFNFRNGEINGL